MSLGEKLLELRKTRGYSQKELADIIGEKSAKVISNWETNLNKPDIDKLARLCSVFGCSPSWFIEVGQDFEITSDEMVLVTKWRGLDDLGKSVAMCNIDFQLDRWNSFDIDKSDTDTDEPSKLFIDKSDADYYAMKEKCKELIMLKKNSFLRESEIRLLLAYNDGYNGKISIADLIMIFNGMKVPSQELYSHIYEILERTQKEK